MIFKKKTKLSEFIENDEPLARYIFSKEHYSTQKKRIKRQAFMPPPKNQDKLSVIRQKNCSKDCLLKIGKKLEKQRNQSLKALCSIITQDVRTLDLDVVSDTSNNQHRRHANIIKFPYSEAKTRQIADKLATKASENKSLEVF